MTEQLCQCGEPTAGTVLCRRCTKTLDVAIANVRAYVADLDTIRTRQTRYGSAYTSKGGAGREMPLPIDLRFADYPSHNGDARTTGTVFGRGTDLAWSARNTITGWTRVVLEEWQPPRRVIGCDDTLCRRCQPMRAEAHFRRPPRDDQVSCCHYLQRLLPRIVAAEWASDMLDEMLDLERRLRRFVDRPADRWYAGPCTAGLHGLEATWFCGTELYAELGKPEVTCRECGISYDVAERRAWLLAAAEDRWETATTIARAVVVWTDYDRGESRLVRRISDWAKRDRILVRGRREVDGRPRPLYRLGDVLDLLADDARDAEKRSA